VTAAAVVLGHEFPIEILRDSKRMTQDERECAARAVYQLAPGAGLGWASAWEIDRLNIHHATLLAMRRAVAALPAVAALYIVDGRFVPHGLDCDGTSRCLPVVRADTRIPAVQAASIIAKTARDRWMIRYSWIDDRYEFDRHKGYPTPRHRQLVARYGPSDIHRLSFRMARPGATASA
jgi:ribonuclease HII